MAENTSQKDVTDILKDLVNDIKGKKYTESKCKRTYTRGE